MSRKSERTRAESITFATSLTILAAIIVLAVWAGFRTGSAEPVIEVEVHLEDIRVEAGDYYLPITVTNAGGSTAQDVVLLGELISPNGEAERAEVSFAYLAGAEQEQAELVFQHDPAAGDLSVRVTSFVVP